MLPVLLCLVAFFAQALGAVTSSGLYRISSNYFLLDVISQNGNSIVSDATEKGTLEQLWSVVVRGTSATIQNAATLSFMSVDLSGPVGTVVPSAKPHNWTITPDATSSESAATIHSCGKAVALAFELEPLQLFEPPRRKPPALEVHPGCTPAARIQSVESGGGPVPRSSAEGLRLRVRTRGLPRRVGLQQQQQEPLAGGTVFRIPGARDILSGRLTGISSQWKVAGTSACGGRPTLQNAATRDFLSSGADFDSYMGAVKPVPDSSPFAWSYGFVGGQLTILDRDGLDDVTTLGILGNQIVLYTTSVTGPGTTPDQTWVFVPVP